MDRASLAVQYVFLFTLAAGIVVLLAAVQSTAMSGATKADAADLGRKPRHGAAGCRRGIFRAGFSIGTLAAFGATGIGWLLAQRLFSLQYTLDPMVVGCGLLCVRCSSV